MWEELMNDLFGKHSGVALLTSRFDFKKRSTAHFRQSEEIKVLREPYSYALFFSDSFWYSCGDVCIGWDDSIIPPSFHFIFNYGERIGYITVISSKQNGKYLGEGADYREIKNFLKALKDPTLLPLCINYKWAKPLVSLLIKEC